MDGAPTLELDAYGHLTATFRRLLELADGTSVQVIRQEVTPCEDDRHVREFLSCLGDLLGQLTLETEYRAGTWSTFADVVGSCQLWTERAGAQADSRVADAVKDPKVAKLIGPPLWPVPGMVNVVSPLLAHKEKVVGVVSQEFIESAWRLLCLQEDWLWGALLWELSDEAGANVYEAALRLAVSGIYPLCLRSDSVVFFSFTQ